MPMAHVKAIKKFTGRGMFGKPGKTSMHKKSTEILGSVKDLRAHDWGNGNAQRKAAGAKAWESLTKELSRAGSGHFFDASVSHDQAAQIVKSLTQACLLKEFGESATGSNYSLWNQAGGAYTAGTGNIANAGTRAGIARQVYSALAPLVAKVAKEKPGGLTCEDFIGQGATDIRGIRLRKELAQLEKWVETGTWDDGIEFSDLNRIQQNNILRPLQLQAVRDERERARRREETRGQEPVGTLEGAEILDEAFQILGKHTKKIPHLSDIHSHWFGEHKKVRDPERGDPSYSLRRDVDKPAQTVIEASLKQAAATMADRLQSSLMGADFDLSSQVHMRALRKWVETRFPGKWNEFQNELEAKLTDGMANPDGAGGNIAHAEHDDGAGNPDSIIRVFQNFNAGNAASQNLLKEAMKEAFSKLQGQEVASGRLSIATGMRDSTDAVARAYLIGRGEHTIDTADPELNALMQNVHLFQHHVFDALTVFGKAVNRTFTKRNDRKAIQSALKDMIQTVQLGLASVAGNRGVNHLGAARAVGDGLTTGVAATMSQMEEMGFKIKKFLTEMVDMSDPANPVLKTPFVDTDGLKNILGAFSQATEASTGVLERQAHHYGAGPRALNGEHVVSHMGTVLNLVGAGGLAGRSTTGGLMAPGNVGTNALVKKAAETEGIDAEQIHAIIGQVMARGIQTDGTIPAEFQRLLDAIRNPAFGISTIMPFLKEAKGFFIDEWE